MKKLKGVCVGTGYFSHFQYEAWKRIPEAAVTACCGRNADKAEALRKRHGLEKAYTNFEEMLDREKPDFVDVITPPGTHLEMCRQAARRGVHIICQKPLAPEYAEAEEIVRLAREAKVRFMVHENFRFQPWHREIKRLLDDGAIGRRLHGLHFRSRQGDGWGEDAYLARQPYFREMKRFLVFELGVHFIDTFRYLAGNIVSAYAVLRRLNPVIQGEDAALLMFRFENEALGVWDANRYNEYNCADSRYTFGDFLVEGGGGSIRLYADGRLTVQKLGEKEQDHPYRHEPIGFCADCVYHTQRHFMDRLLDGKEFETHGEDYLRNLRVQDAVYESAKTNRPVNVPRDG